MASKRCYYEVLGVARNASDDEIADRYRDLAMKYHPDRNQGDESAADKFKEAAEAFDVLSHREKRARYDRYGHAGVQGQGGATQFHDPSDIFAAFGDIFGDLFGGGLGGGFGRRNRVRQGADIRCQVTINLQEAARGCEKAISFRRHRTCDTCHGSGCRPGTQPVKCQYCGGAGRVVQSTGIFSMQTTCPACKGAGSQIKDPCRECRGSGYVRDDVTRNVSIPAGVDGNTRLRLQGEGEPSPNGGPPGDCYCFIAVEKHPLFEREGQHLICQVPVSYAQAALGATIDVPTLDGPKPLEIRQGTQPGDVYTMSGEGMPSPRQRGRGDLLVQVLLEVPKQLDDEHEALLRKLADLEHANVTPHRKSFFEKLKECFVPDDRSDETED
ncbi:MAG: molecular chaperone DnaJ [Pirellulales bacterium]|nr:molecular chaperone DnaJ [Pirellulales bacterium]